VVSDDGGFPRTFTRIAAMLASSSRDGWGGHLKLYRFGWH